MNQVKKKRLANRRRKARVRYRVTRAGNKLRLSVFRSLQHIYVQIIDDVNGKTLVAASTLSPELKGLAATGNIEAAQKVGELVAEQAKACEIETVTFDRGANLYHGRIKALAEAARAGGLKF